METIPTGPPALMNVKQFCATHGIARSTFYLLAKQGKGPALTKIGRRCFVSQESAAEWRRANTLPAGGRAARKLTHPTLGK
jgi:predicted DNA-binding transcriptional regulator AlpA